MSHPHRELSIVAVVVVIISLVATAVWFFFGRTTQSTSTDRLPVPADAWTDGTEELWNLTVEADADDYLFTSATYMVLIKVDGSTANFHSWKIDGNSPEELVQTTIDYKGPDNNGILGSHFILGDMSYDQTAAKVFNIETGEEESAPWDATRLVTVQNNSLAVACDHTGNCTGYDSDLEEIWAETIDPRLIAEKLTVQSDGTTYMFSCATSPCKIVNFSSGEVTDSELDLPEIDVSGMTPAYPYRDGWLVDYHDDEGKHVATLINTDGKRIADISNFQVETASLSSGGSQTLDDIANTSDGAITFGLTGESCDEQVVNNHVLGEDPFLIGTSDEGKCLIAAVPLMSASSDGSVVAIGNDYRLGVEPDIQALIDTENGTIIWQSALTGPFAPIGIHQSSLSTLAFGRLVTPDTLISIEVDDTTTVISAYRPG